MDVTEACSVLGVGPPQNTPEYLSGLKVALQRELKANHPDRNPNEQEAAQARFLRAKEAYETIVTEINEGGAADGDTTDEIREIYALITMMVAGFKSQALRIDELTRSVAYLEHELACFRKEREQQRRAVAGNLRRQAAARTGDRLNSERPLSAPTPVRPVTPGVWNAPEEFDDLDRMVGSVFGRINK